MAYVPPHKRSSAPAPGPAPRESWAEAQRRMDARRAPAPPPAPSVAPTSPETTTGGGSLADWLREARQGYVPKSRAEIAAELATLNYDQLRKRAGPPPSITSEEYGGVHEQGGEGEGARVCVSFDESLRLFKQGHGGPPEPLCFDGRDDGEVICDGIAAEVYVGLSKAQKLRRAYSAWYAQWGARLNYLWRAEHPQLQKTTATTKPKPKPQPKIAEPEYIPRRILEEASDKSGW
jgi:hypothetical protein